MRRIVVTGAAGFIGSHLCEALVAAGEQVIGVDSCITGRLGNLATIADHPRFRLIQKKVTHTRRALRDADAIIHLAAHVGPPHVVQYAHAVIRDHLADALVISDAVKHSDARLLVASSSEVYGGAIPPHVETDALMIGPTDAARSAYAASKVAVEHLMLRNHPERATVMRFFNVAGPRQRAEGGCVLPLWVAGALHAGHHRGTFLLHDAEHQRAFADVADVVRCIVALLDCEGSVGEVVNVGQPEPIRMGALAEMVADSVEAATGHRPEIRHAQRGTGSNGSAFMPIRYPDVTKLRALIGFVPPNRMRASVDAVVAEQCGQTMRPAEVA